MKRIVNVLDKLNWGRRAYAVFVLGASAAMALPAQTFTTLFSFDGTNGQEPSAALVQDTNGDFYGVSGGGGANGGGTVFKITPSGRLTTLYSFCAQSGCADGEAPLAGLVQATNGDFYGMTQLGGASGDGTVFKISPRGALTTLHTFCAQGYPNCTDGRYPYGGLVQAANGDLYGTTSSAGGNPDPYNPYGAGTIFKISPSGTLTTVYDFCAQSGCADGYNPNAGLIQAASGDLYGTTSAGGTSGGGAGTVFKITLSGTLTTIYSFCPSAVFSECPDGAVPAAVLVRTANGDVYGTTEFGGANPNPANDTGAGTIFKITPSGALTTLYSFCTQSGCTDGYFPTAGLTQATDGNLYGATWFGGADNSGTVFKISPSGTLTTLYNFCSQTNCADGECPGAALFQDTDGGFYGTTSAGGTISSNCTFGGGTGCGTVFSLSVGLSPFVETQPTSGKVGAAVKILGTNLTGVTSVTFKGTRAAITFTQPSEISTTVPTGATSGKVQVTTPNGTLLSNVAFRVLP